MTRKDRIAVALSVPYIFIVIFGAIADGEPGIIIVLGAPVYIYWAYRFIKNDISFLKKKEPTE